MNKPSTSDRMMSRSAIDKVRHLGGQRIVVANPDFFNGHGIVFVDDGDDPEFDQGGQVCRAFKIVSDPRGLRE